MLQFIDGTKQLHPQKYDSVCYRWVSRENLDYKKWAVYGSDDSNKESYTF